MSYGALLVAVHLLAAQTKPLADLPPNTAKTFGDLAPGSTTLAVLDAGRKPQRVLGYDVGAQPSTTISMRWKNEMSMNGRTMSVPTAVMKFDVDQGADGEALVLVSKISNVDVADEKGMDPEMVRGFVTSLRSSFGTDEMEMRVNERGQKLDAGAGPFGGRPSLDLFVVPFPDVPLGVGATWETRAIVPFPDMSMRTRTVYRLDRLDAKGGTVSMVSRFDNDTSKAPWTTAKGGTQMQMKESYGTVRGTLEFSRTTVLGSRGEVDTRIHNDARTRTADGKPSQPAVQDARLLMSFERAPDPKKR